MAKWNYEVDIKDIFHNEDLSFTEHRDAIVARFRAQSWFKQLVSEHEDYELSDLIDDLSDTANGAEFDEVWNDIYDWADHYRMWIRTF
jgi:hypothetical protein